MHTRFSLTNPLVYNREDIMGIAKALEFMFPKILYDKDGQEGREIGDRK